MKLKLTLWAIGLSLTAVSIWAGVTYYRTQVRLAREAQLQAERAEREAARAKAYIELRSPDEIAADKARAAAEQAKREAQDRAEAKYKDLQAAQARIDEIKRERTMRHAIAGAKALKQGMKDPEAFVLRSAVMHENGSVCYEYRAKNSFGAILPGRALVSHDTKIHVEESIGRELFALLWKVECAGAGTEVADALKRSGAI